MSVAVSWQSDATDPVGTYADFERALVTVTMTGAEWNALQMALSGDLAARARFSGATESALRVGLAQACRAIAYRGWAQ